MSTMRMGARPSVQASSPPASPVTPAGRNLGRLRIWFLRRWLKWRCRHDPSEAAYRLLRMDDATLAALGVCREAVRADLLHIDVSPPRAEASNAHA